MKNLDQENHKASQSQNSSLDNFHIFEFAKLAFYKFEIDMLYVLVWIVQRLPFLYTSDVIVFQHWALSEEAEIEEKAKRIIDKY